MQCLFCKIINGEVMAKKIYEDEKVFAFYDIDPKAPVHFLVVPKKHIASPCEIEECDEIIVGHIYSVIAKLAKELNLSEGYRIVANCGKEGGQTVGHLHFHVLAGRMLSWPPG